MRTRRGIVAARSGIGCDRSLSHRSCAGGEGCRRDRARRAARHDGAGAARDAAIDPRMWLDICLANREAVVTMLDRYADDLAALREAIDRNDGEAITEVFARAKAARDQFCREERVE